MPHQSNTWKFNFKNELERIQSYICVKIHINIYMISIVTKSTLTIKNIAHLTIGLKFNVYFMRNNSFMKKIFKL